VYEKSALSSRFGHAFCIFTNWCGGTKETAGSGKESPTTTEKPKFNYAMGLYKPFNFKESGKLTGFDVEIGAEIARRMGMEPNPVNNLCHRYFNISKYIQKCFKTPDSIQEPSPNFLIQFKNRPRISQEPSPNFPM